MLIRILITFCGYNSKIKENGIIYGKVEKNNNDIKYYYFIPSILQKFLKENNINWEGIRKKLVEKNYLIKSSQNEYTHNCKLEKMQQRLVKIKNIF